MILPVGNPTTATSVAALLSAAMVHRQVEEYRCAEDTKSLCTSELMVTQRTITEVPPVLLMEIPRYRYGERLDTEVQVDLQLMINGTRYNLTSAVLHNGTSPKVGHYVAIYNKSATWYFQNDHIVREVDVTTISEIPHNVYVVAYRACKKNV